MATKLSRTCPECGSSKRFMEDRDDTTLCTCDNCGEWYYWVP
ncbi:putative RNA-binding Zn-ribbon protein involved in translation (DUF1610 family) [Elusimicrobium simillimum]